MSLSYLDGKAIVITGAGSGLGRGYALRAAAEGASVVVNDVDADAAARVCREIRHAGGRAVAFAASVAQPETGPALVEVCVAQFGGLHGVVSNAGLLYSALPWEETDPANLARMVEVNVLGTMWVGAAALTYMRAHGGGSLVTIASGAALGISGLASYGATKGAVASLTYGWALDVAGCGIRVNCVSPIGTTQMSTQYAAGRDAELVDPASIAPLVCWLLGDDAGEVHGQFIRFTGTRLSLVAPARLGDLVLERDQWNLANLSMAFTTDFADRLHTPGLA